MSNAVGPAAVGLATRATDLLRCASHVSPSSHNDTNEHINDCQHKFIDQPLRATEQFNSMRTKKIGANIQTWRPVEDICLVQCQQCASTTGLLLEVRHMPQTDSGTGTCHMAQLLLPTATRLPCNVVRSNDSNLPPNVGSCLFKGNTFCIECSSALQWHKLRYSRRTSKERNC
eukprot:4426525-Amphidinium_carterae.1